MKKVYNILAGVVVLAAFVSGCTQELENHEVGITSVKCSIAQIDVEEDFATGILDTLTVTKASFSGNNFIWSFGDRIGIVPNTGSQIYFAVNKGAGTSTASFDGGDWAMKSTGTFYAYYPLYPDIFLSKDHVSVSYTGQTQSGNNNNLHTGDYWTLYTTGTTAVENTLNFSFNHLTSFFKTYVTVPAGTYTKITFSAPSEVFMKDGYFDLSAPTPTIVGTTFTNELYLDLQNVTFAEETELTGYLVVAPVDITGVPITVTVYKDGEPAFEYTLTKANPMVAAKTYAFRATSITQLAASTSQANALFAAGATSVTITEPLTENATIILPNTSEAVTISLPTAASSSALTVSYPPTAESYPATLSITGPEEADLDIRTPNSTVTINGVSYDQITSRTAANTCIIPAGVTVNNLKVVQGGVQVYGTVSQIDLSEQEDDAIINVSGTVTSLLGEDDEEYTPATGISLNKSSINVYAGETETLTTTVVPVGAYPNVVWSSSDETVASISTTGVVSAIAAGSATITAKTISGGFTASCEVTVVVPLPDYVDLGLSVKWATRNLCETGFVSSPTDYGDYYAWGETEAKADYSWSTYKWCNGSSSTLTKYCPTEKPNNWAGAGSPDGKTVLDPEDDAACAILGGNWRMPTYAELAELRTECTWTWTTQNGINGRLVTGPNGNSIFLPATGRRENSDLIYVGSTGRYWSSSLDTGLPNFSWSVNFTSDYVEKDDYYRCAGRSIRPVYMDYIPVLSVSLDRTSLELYSGETALLTSTISPANATEQDVYWQTSDESVATVMDGRVTAIGRGTATITVYATSGASASCTVTVKTIVTPEAVDLGLSVKWATFNLGATSPEEYGDYYAWGEVETKKNYNWSFYKWSRESTTILTKYCPNNKTNYWAGTDSPDGKTELEPVDDVVNVTLGGNWRMPTEVEWTELRTQCSWVWTKQNSVKGMIVTGPNGNSIFLPAAGCMRESYKDYLGSDGYYWSSTLDTDSPPHAGDMSFDSDDVSQRHDVRCNGFSVRPVL